MVGHSQTETDSSIYRPADGKRAPLIDLLLQIFLKVDNLTHKVNAPTKAYNLLYSLLPELVLRKKNRYIQHLMCYCFLFYCSISHSKKNTSNIHFDLDMLSLREYTTDTLHRE